ncbi:MAG: HAD-IIIA family hydrolase [Sphingobacteriales bacterium]|nr:MAG: HAD-IIIA family hydrolase [Sphingobacteriales bacterium]
MPLSLNNFKKVQQWNITQDWTLFIDRDGVINTDMGNVYVKSLEQFTFIQNVPECLVMLRRFFGKFIVVSNQQGVGKGLVTHQEVQMLFAHIQKSVSDLNGKIDAFYYCPHLAAVKCLCRKPGIGMALQAKIDFPDIDFKKSVIIGDRETDMIFGKKVGMKTVLVNNNELLTPPKNEVADIVCKDLCDFTQILLNI